MKFLLSLALLVGCTLAFPEAPRPVRQVQEEFEEREMQKRGGFTSDIMGSMSGSVVKATVKKFLDSPLAKKLADPKNLEEFLNSDVDASGPSIFTPELFDMVLNSDLVKNLVTPQFADIVYKSKMAKKLLNPDRVKELLANPTVAKYLAPERIMKFLNSDILVSVIDPALFKWALEKSVAIKGLLNADAMNGFMTTRAYKALVRYEFIHHMVYSEVGKALLSPAWGLNIMNNPELSALVTPENVADWIASPAITQHFELDVIKKIWDSTMLKNLFQAGVQKSWWTSESVVRISTPEMWESVLNSAAAKNLWGAESISAVVATPAWKAVCNEAAAKKYAATESLKALVGNADSKACLNSIFHAMLG